MQPAPQSSHFPDSFYRVAVKALIVRDGKLLMTEDVSGSTALDGGPEWDLPGGGLDFGETFAEGLRREIREEMGLEVTTVADKPLYMWTNKRTNTRDMPWFWVLILAFPVEVRDLAFTPTDECRRIEFMSKADMLSAKEKISGQIVPLIDLFNPADFA